MGLSNQTIQKWLIDRVRISRGTAEGDQFGGVDTVFKNIDFNVPARLYPMSGAEERTVAGKTFLPTKRMIVNPGVDVAAGDHVRVRKSKAIFFVVAVFERRDLTEEQFKQCELAEIDL